MPAAAAAVVLTMMSGSVLPAAHPARRLTAGTGRAAGAGWSEPKNLKFSHRFHLTRARAKCAGCHAAAAGSTAATDNLLPTEKTCLACHDGRKARKDCTVCHADPKAAVGLPAAQRGFRFSHQQHLEFGDLGGILSAAIRNRQYLSQPPPAVPDLQTKNPCAGCHRGLQRTGFATARNLPRMADCMVCHTKIDPPFSCEFCHLKDVQLKPASHAPDWLDLHSSRKVQLDKNSCTICHGVNFRCLGCH